MAFIYSLIENNTIIYIGRTGVPETRMADHKSNRFNGRNIKMEIIEECEDEDERARENFWINHYNDLGYKLENRGKLGKYSISNKYYVPLKTLKSMLGSDKRIKKLKTTSK